MAAMHPVDYYSTFTKNCSGHFREEEVKSIRAFYYAMCAEADAMLGEWRAVIQQISVSSEILMSSIFCIHILCCSLFFLSRPGDFSSKTEWPS